MIETSIALLAIVEILSWLFLIASLFQVEDFIPCIILGAAIIMNIVFNLIMHFKIIKDTEEYDSYNNSKASKFITIVISYKAFYHHNVRY